MSFTVSKTYLERRASLLKEMQWLSEKGIDCSVCPGHCCTYVSNSMQVTPLETFDMFHELVRLGLWNDELVKRLNECVRFYRLDKPTPSDGRRNLIRRTYTCPLFLEKENGCLLSFAHKPYGCLAFNAKRPKTKGAGQCQSNQVLLQDLENQGILNCEENEQLKIAYNIPWEKHPIPVALLYLADKFDI